MQKKHRVFIAINLPPEVKQYLGNFREQQNEIPAKWVTPDNLHITLAFLGAVTDLELGEICTIAKEIAKNHAPFDIHLHGIGYGPAEKQPPRMIWVKGDKSKALSFLKRDLQNELAERTRVAADHKAFSPHITLAKINQWQWRAIEPEERPEINIALDLSFTVESIEVMESELKKGGPIYTVIESCPLEV